MGWLVASSALSRMISSSVAELARSRGVEEEQLVVDPGPDFAKTPAETVAAE